MILVELYQLIRKALARNLVTMTVLYGSTIPTVSIVIKNAVIKDGKIELIPES